MEPPRLPHRLPPLCAARHSSFLHRSANRLLPSLVVGPKGSPGRLGTTLNFWPSTVLLLMCFMTQNTETDGSLLVAAISNQQGNWPEEGEGLR